MPIHPFPTARTNRAGIVPLPVRVVTLDETARWLSAGWRDFLQAPITSLAYGSIFVVIGYTLLAWLNKAGLGSLVLPFVAGFMLVGPLAAVGLYEVARRHERDQEASLLDAGRALVRARVPIGQMGLLLMLAIYAWIQLALLLFMLFFGSSPPPLDDFVGGLLASPRSWPFLLIGTLIGGAIAALVFSVSVVSLPLLLDRPEVGVMRAMATSWQACKVNPVMMVGWAATLALLTFCGLALFFVGLAVVLPWLAYASWHAYRSLVEAGG